MKYFVKYSGFKTDRFFNQYMFSVFPAIHIGRSPDFISVCFALWFWRITVLIHYKQ